MCRFFFQNWILKTFIKGTSELTNNDLNAWFPCTQADYATAATSQTVTRAPSIAPSTADSTLTTISREELKGALLSVMARKDELAGRLLNSTTYDICPEF